MTAKTLEKILSLVKGSFAVGKTTTTSTITPTCTESVVMRYGSSSYTSEGGGYIEATPNTYYGCRQYHTLSGTHLFTESLPLEEVCKWSGCSHCGSYVFDHYVIDKSAKPAAEKLDVTSTKIYAELFGLPLSLTLTQVAIPEGIAVWSESKLSDLGIASSYIRKGKIPFFGKVE